MAVIWITGARGFLGRHVARESARRGSQVLGLGHGAWLGEDYGRWGLAQWLNGEVNGSNLGLLQRSGGNPALIVHCAGGSSVGASLQSPLEDFARSVESTAMVLEWIRRSAPDCGFILSSSAAVYGDGYSVSIAESLPAKPASPYGAHKLAAETLTASYRTSYGLNTAIVRLFSLYGEELRKQLIWDACLKLKSDPAMLSFGGNGQELRDFVHVTDAAAFISELGEALSHRRELPHAINCGTGLGRTVASVIESVARACGARAQIGFSGERRQGDPQSLVADIDLARGLGWCPQRSFDEGIRRYVEWFRTQGVSR